MRRMSPASQEGFFPGQALHLGPPGSGAPDSLDSRPSCSDHDARTRARRPHMTVELSRDEVKILLQSLANCLSTCKTHAAKPSAKCPDCDAAKAVKAKLQKQVKA